VYAGSLESLEKHIISNSVLFSSTVSEPQDDFESRHSSSKPWETEVSADVASVTTLPGEEQSMGLLLRYEVQAEGWHIPFSGVFVLISFGIVIVAIAVIMMVDRSRFANSIP
jgi:hypothetical protein